MSDNNINVILDKGTIIIALGFILGSIACFLLKKGIERSILASDAYARAKGRKLSYVAAALLALGVATVLTSSKIVQLVEPQPVEEVTPVKKKKN